LCPCERPTNPECYRPAASRAPTVILGIVRFLLGAILGLLRVILGIVKLVLGAVLWLITAIVRSAL